MTAPTDQPVVKTEEAPASTLPALPPLPTMPPGIGAGSEAGYSPLSLLALASLILAAAYALTIAIGGLTSLFNRGPLLLPLWSFLFPVLAAVLCLFARYRIKVSEGTLSGRVLTTWGLVLSLLFGLGYSAYYLATYLAVTNQAQVRAVEWLEELKKAQAEEHAEKAFWLTLPHAQRTENRQDLEILHNTPTGGSPGAVGPYTGFVGADFVRLMALGGAQTQIEYKGVDDWGFENNGFLVKLRYDVTTPQARFTLIVGVQGVDSRNRDKAGRQWAINLVSTHLDKGIELTEAGQDVVKQGENASAYARRLVQQVNTYGWPSAYFLTLPPKEAADQMEMARNVGLLLGIAKAIPFLRGISEYHQGNLVRKDAPMFWADDKQRDAIIAAVKNQFDPARAKQLPPIEIKPARIPDIRIEGKDTFARVDIRMMVVADSGEGPKPFAVDARLVLKESKEDPKNPTWYLHVVELIRARSPQAPQRPGAQPAQGM